MWKTTEMLKIMYLVHFTTKSVNICLDQRIAIKLYWKNSMQNIPSGIKRRYSLSHFSEAKQTLCKFHFEKNVRNRT